MTDAKSDELIPLRDDHAYLRATPSSAYWSIAPHLIQQSTESSCSLATATMLINAIRGRDGQLRVGQQASEAGMLERLADSGWRAAVAEGGGGLSLTEFAAAMERALLSYGSTERWRVATRPVTDSEAAIPGLRTALAAMEGGNTGFAAANFHLDQFYGDGVDVGHFSPIGAYDAARDRVLVLDVYKKSYEPSWAPLRRLAEAMARAKVGEPRGYILVTRMA